MEVMEAVKKKVLVVDDEQSLLRILRIKLKVSGYDVITAFNGREALLLVASDHPDIMLLDIIMPDMDGFDVLQNLKPGNKLPVIVFSARPENATKALGMGACDFVSKPFDIDHLVGRIQKVLDKCL
jgi:two-component system KDP operon response regulator KdpE